MKPGFLIACLACAALTQVNGLAQADKTGPNTTAVAPAKTIAIVGGKVLTVTHGTIDVGTVVMSDGKIVAVGPAKTTKVPAGAEDFRREGNDGLPGVVRRGDAPGTHRG